MEARPLLTRIAFTITVLALVSPGVSAAHWSLYYAGADSYVGATLEDDGTVVTLSGNYFDGRANSVVEPGRIPGDGGRFLDAIVGNHVGFGTAVDVTDIYFGSATASVFNGQPVLAPGERRVSAWYGSWLDLDDDGIIDDVHDANCGPTRCAADEFAWRGIGSGEGDLAVATFITPYTSTGAAFLGAERFVRPGYTTTYGDVNRFHTFELVDHSSRANAEQGWWGGFDIKTDSGFVSSYYTIVVAGAQKITGKPGFDLDDPAGLVDVDRYDAMSPDVGALFTAAVGAYATLDPWPSVKPTWDALSSDAIGTIVGIAADVIAEANRANRDSGGFAKSQLTTPDAKEPNTVWDDFENRAFFGGVGDHAGSHNSYPAYVDAYHLYADNVARTVACAGVYAPVAPLAIELSATPLCQWVPSETVTGATDSPSTFDPVGRHVLGERASGSFLTFETYIFLWKDRNGDAASGNVCDPSDDAAFDAERNTCRETPYPYPHKLSGIMEHIHMCSTSDAPGGRFSLTPLGGPWPNVIVVKDVHETTRVAFDPALDVRSDSAPIELRWRDECINERRLQPGVYARDAVFFPTGGSTVPILVESRVAIPGFKDTGLGIDVASEFVKDIDIIPATL